MRGERKTGRSKTCGPSEVKSRQLVSYEKTGLAAMC